MWIYVFTSLFAGGLFVWERMKPAFPLPPVKSWYQRVAIVFALTLLTGEIGSLTWVVWLNRLPRLELLSSFHHISQGIIIFFFSTLIYYFWHWARHHFWPLWDFFHQVHHSPARIEVATSFYVHPSETIAASMINATFTFLLGGSVESIPYNVGLFSLLGIFYHSNIKTSAWLDYFISTPELHRIHHIRGKQWGNFSDLPLWDRIFGTYIPRQNPEPNLKRGFRDDLENKLSDLLKFRNVLSRYPKE